MSFLEDLTHYRAARFELVVRPHDAAGFEAVVRVDGEAPDAYTLATTKGHAVFLALASALGRALEESRPRFCSICDDGPSIRERHDRIVEPFRKHQAIAAGTYQVGGKDVLACWSCVERLHVATRREEGR